MRANVYIDGFNLYFGALRGTPYKWLDLCALSRQLLRPHVDLHRVRYFTARVSDRANNPGIRDRQNAYIRALETLPEVEIDFGMFQTRKVRMRRADGRGFVDVWKTEEKGSDVNLATRLLVDATSRDADIGLVVSNDVDLLLPIREARRLGMTIGVSAPIFSKLGGKRYPHRELVAAADFVVHIDRAKPLRLSQLPPQLTDKHGTIKKPGEWA